MEKVKAQQGTESVITIETSWWKTIQKSRKTQHITSSTTTITMTTSTDLHTNIKQRGIYN